MLVIGGSCSEVVCLCSAHTQFFCFDLDFSFNLYFLFLFSMVSYWRTSENDRWVNTTAEICLDVEENLCPTVCTCTSYQNTA